MSIHKNLALIGAGHWGKNLARNFHTLGVLHTICDTSPILLQAYAKDYEGVALTTCYADVLDNNHISMVAIAAPAILHYKLAKQALLAGKDVYVEKPLCLHTFEGEELIELAQQQGKVLMVGHLLHYHPAVVHMQQMIARGDLGKLLYISSHRLSLGQIRTEENNLWSFAPHDISVILSLLNKLPHSVRCVGQDSLSKGVVDNAITMLEFDHDVRAHIYTNWFNPVKEQKMVITGTKGMLVFDDIQPWEQKLVYFKDPVLWENGTKPRAQKVEGQPIIIAQNEPLKEECQHFIDCCKNRTSPKTDGQEGLRVLHVLEAAQHSLSNKGNKQSPFVKINPYFAHSSAIIDKGASIGQGSKIWHFSHIMDKASLGNNCNIGQNVVVSPNATLGNNVKVQNNVSVYTGVVCEDDVFLGPSMVFTNINNPRSAVNRRGEYQITYIRQGASIGANATIVCGTELGTYCFIGAGTVVVKDVKPYALMVGNPARQIGWMSRHGEKLDLPIQIAENEEKHASCPATGETYILRGDAVTIETNEPVPSYN